MLTYGRAGCGRGGPYDRNHPQVREAIDAFGQPKASTSLTALCGQSLRRIVLTCIIATLVPVIPFLIVGEIPGDQWVRSQGDDLMFGLAATALLAADCVAPVPSSVMMTLLGARLGLWEGWLWSLAGLVSANLLGYAFTAYR